MELADRHVVVTGAGSGIGRGLARRFAAEGARAVVVADLNEAAAESVADEIGGLGVATDVSREEQIQALIERAKDANGPIDLFFSNAGVPGPGGGPEAPNDEWQLTWEVNVMAHVWAARALLPEMVARGEGYLCSTASAAGLLTQVSALAYSATKHAAVAVAEWISINYGDAGVRVSCLCPQGVRTPMLDLALEDPVGAAPSARRGAARARGSGRDGGGRDPRRALPDPAPSGRGGLHGREGHAERAVAARDAPTHPRSSTETR